MEIYDVYFYKLSFGKFENFMKFWAIENLIWTSKINLEIERIVKKRRMEFW